MRCVSVIRYVGYSVQSVEQKERTGCVGMCYKHWQYESKSLLSYSIGIEGTNRQRPVLQKHAGGDQEVPVIDCV